MHVVASSAARSVVLLKNQGDILPLDGKKVQNILVMGDAANAPSSFGGETGPKQRFPLVLGPSEAKRSPKLPTFKRLEQNNKIPRSTCRGNLLFRAST